MGFEDIGKKVEEVKGKIDAALEKTDIDDKIMDKVGSIVGKPKSDDKKDE